MVAEGDNFVPKTYDDAVRVLTRSHGESLDPGGRLFAFDDPSKREVRLLEVTACTPATGVMPIAIRASDHFPFRSVIIQVTPEEWKIIEARELPLPTGWDLGSRREAWPIV